MNVPLKRAAPSMQANYRFSGHETFPCRYAWLPKAFRALETKPDLFTSEEDAMVTLGVGKNMVRAIRFWVQATGIAEVRKPGNGLRITEFGKALLKKGGLDPFLEDKRTLWLLHWQISAQRSEPLFAWQYLLNQWPKPEFTRSEVLIAFATQASRLSRSLSSVTLEQHFDTFLHTYVPTHGRKGEVKEDNLDCPLVELELIVRVGDRAADKGARREPVYSFDREEKEDVTPALFVFCIADFWAKFKSHEQSLTLRDVALSSSSPGQVFKLSEWDLRRRLGTLIEDSEGEFEFQDRAMFQRIIRKKETSLLKLLRAAYSGEVVNG